MKTIKVCNGDSDVVTILVGAFLDLISVQQSTDIWVAFGKGKNFRFYSINVIGASIGESRARALPVFHAWSGCDTTSAFRGRGKSQHGKLGKLMKKSLRHSISWLLTLLRIYALTLITFRKSKE